MKRTTTTMRILVSIAAVAALDGTGPGLDASAATLNGHTVQVDGSGKIVPWTGLPVPTDGFDRVLQNAWNYLLYQVPNDGSTGWPAYFSQSYLNPDTQQMAGWPSNPAGMNAMFIESALATYAYSGDTAVLGFARSVADHHLDAGMTPSGWVWPNVPYASGDDGSLTYQGALYGNTTGVGDGRGVIEPDKIGELGYSLLRLYEVTGDTRYRDAAVAMGEVLAARLRAGSATKSPWPFRVYAETGVVREEYTAHVIAPIELFDELTRLGIASLAVQLARQITWTWLMTYPMQNGNWSNYFEDVAIQPSATNLTQMNALMTARYLLRHPDTDPDWETHVRGIISWVEANFGVPDTGATKIREQNAFPHPMGSHTARYASVNALLAAATGDANAREKAYRSFNWATYMDRGNGIVIDGPSVNNQWFTDGYGDYIRHFLVGFAAIPEWAPSDANHMTHSTSAVQAISYSATSVSYVTRDGASSETFRLLFVPGAVHVDGQALPQRSDLDEPGWTYDAATRVLRIRRDAGANVEVLSGELICSNGLDDDGDGLVDLADPACSSGLPALPDSSAPLESTQCQDGMDNNGDGRIDFDGGQSIHGACGGGACPPGVSDLDANGVADPDPWCAARPWRDRESQSCGLGAELVGVGLLLHALRPGRQRVRSDGA